MRPSPCIATALIALLAANAAAAIIPYWRVNPITVAAVAANPQLAGAISFSLVIETTPPSGWELAGLAFQAPAGASFFHQIPLGGDGPPDPALVALHPDLAYDSYVFGTPRGKYVPEAPNFPPERAINLLWGPPPSASGSGIELARLTLIGAFVDLPLEPFWLGEVRTTDQPLVSVRVPTVHISGLLQIPEPASLSWLCAAMLGLARRPASVRQAR